MKYDKYRYIFPPRPRNAISPDDLSFWDDANSMIAQLKLNGSNATIYTDGKKVIVMNRHDGRLTGFNINENEILSLYRGTGWMILNGEYLNKSKMDETGKPFNHKLVIFDVLCYNGDYLVGKTFSQRIELLDSLYGTNDSDKEYLFGISENVYRVKSYSNGFKNIFDKFTKIDIIEGLVMKRCNAKLEVGSSENNNSKSQVKCRKSTLNYKY
jgi:hypothetical protein